jgi:thiol-disulfide isomerase/thioredoxin
MLHNRSAISMIIPLLMAAVATAQPTTAPTTPTTQRSPEKIEADLQATGEQLQKLLQSPAALMNPAKRQEIAPQALPLLRKLEGLFVEMSAAQPDAAAQLGSVRMRIQSIMMSMGDADARAALEKAAASADKKTASEGQANVTMARWFLTDGKADAQAKVVDDLEKLAKATPEDQMLAMLIRSISAQAADDTIRGRLRKIVAEDLKGPTADAAKEAAKAEEKLNALVNKPLVLKGMALDGKEFSSDAWKGKVVLVDFWATWCGPCRAELPRVKKIYKDYHEKGLELLGVSCDQSREALDKYLKENPEMAWPQLFEKDQQGWHKLATEYGVQGIPTMFLIDKKGVVRSVEARETMEEMIPKLLAE